MQLQPQLAWGQAFDPTPLNNGIPGWAVLFGPKHILRAESAVVACEAVQRRFIGVYVCSSEIC